MVSSSSAVSTSVSSVKPSCAPCRRASRSGRAPAGTACATSRGEQANPAAWHAPSAQVRAIASTSGRGRVACADAYVPSPLDPTVQAAQAAVALFALVALPTIWWTIVVPTSRKKLATDKRKGPLREYLESVDAGDNAFTQWFFQKWLRQMPGRAKARERLLRAQGVEPTAERLQVTQDADPEVQMRGKSAGEKFLSGDNPIVVVMSILGIFVAVQVVLHPR